MLRVIITILKYFLIVLLPFLSLIRGAVYLHVNYNPGPFLAVIGGVFFAFVILMIYITILNYFFTDRIGGISAFKWRAMFSMLLVLGYCSFCLFYISDDNLKHKSLSKELRSVHPIMRLAIGTWSILDKDLIITDANRQPEDYRKMGLPTNSKSLHILQKDGYAYALDLRTKNQSELRNMILISYCKIMGLRTLRHTGTADHLHISLHCHY